MAAFSLGSLVATASVSAEMKNFSFALFCKTAISRHLACDWGDLQPDDIASNDFAVVHGERIFRSYLLPSPVDGEEKIWIITEADRSVTTILFPSDY